MPPDEPNDEEELEELPDDYDTPFNVPDDDIRTTDDDTGQNRTREALDSTHPETDTNLQLEEIYDEGISGAAEAAEPNAGDTVISYHPKSQAGKERSGEVDDTDAPGAA